MSESIWFEGPVSQAVERVNERKLVFLVYIYDSTENSDQLDKVFKDDELSKVLREKSVSVKLQKDSEDAKMFAQLYPIYQTPSVYFIIQGTIKDIGNHAMNAQDIVTKIRAICPQQDPKTRLEEIRKKRAEDEKQKQREREMKRREEGKLAQEAHAAHQDRQNKLILEKKKKEKREEEEYKKRVKEQIAKDRENQKAAKKAENEKLDSRQDSSFSEKSSNTCDYCNLNIKELDGSSLKHRFSASDTLAKVIEWIDVSRTDGEIPYKLFAQFPKRNFDIVDEQRTLSELKLCPSSTLIMKPIKNTVEAYANSSSSRSSWLSYLYSTGDTIYDSIAQAGNSVASYLITPAPLSEPGQRVGSGSQSQQNTNHRINTLNTNTSKKDHQTYNGNSVNQE
ncbi:ubiquitin-related domain-containing protein [Blakeslea trispora]|nr:ubiquitin-related domain-containing protein [Blakeslea trispora]